MVYPMIRFNACDKGKAKQNTQSMVFDVCLCSGLLHAGRFSFSVRSISFLLFFDFGKSESNVFSDQLKPEEMSLR